MGAPPLGPSSRRASRRSGTWSGASTPGRRWTRACRGTDAPPQRAPTAAVTEREFLMAVRQESHALPGAHLDWEKMPGHWLLARMGKRVLRPGGLELTRRMLDALAIRSDDEIVELAPGLGATARMALACNPATYTAVERDEAAATGMQRILRGSFDRCIRGTALDTGLDAGSASVVYGEAMLTMQTAPQKASIVREAFRILKPG